VGDLPRLIRPMLAILVHGLPADQDGYGWELKWDGLRPLERPTSPFDDPVPPRHARDAHWVSPELVGEVAFTEWTDDNLMRHPSWRGLRPDKEPREVHRED
jgi:ATP-dependent DNA ligase